MTEHSESERDGRPGSVRRQRAPRPRARSLAVAVAVLLTVGVGAGLVWAGGSKEGDTGSEQRPKTTIVAVSRTDLSDTREMEGTLGFGAARIVKGSDGGRVTWLPAVGASVTRGKQLYRVDDRPAVVFYGSTPLYRTLDSIGSVGRDVRVVADNLKALGYDIGSQPATGTTVRPQAPASGASTDEEPQTEGKDPTASPGPSGAGKNADEPAGRPSASSRPGTDSTPPRAITVKEGDGVLTASLIDAIKRWQPKAGMEPTGVLDVNDVVVTTGAARVGKVNAQLGADASADLLTITATTKTVTIPVDALDAGSIKKGQKVSVTLPDQSTTPGEVSAISTIIQGAADAEGGGSGDPSQQLNVTVSLQDADAVQDVDAAKVQVQFAAETRKGVLTVPVGALLALSEGGYALRTPEGKLLPVETGLFAKGLVEVSGPGIAVGVKVESAS
ncbi:efflux RND transporter periplasmic adaptor subunit [Streptomyces acidicola]|uniref:peptidoglycan-binding protein n=1 Tax=Streptomyces acidicola TaxID=2596892 RepID=UPI00382EF8CD